MANPGTNKQVPEHSIMDHFNKQNYLGNRFSYCTALSTGATTETAALYVLNPAVTATGFPSGYKSLFVDLIKAAGQTASATTVVNIYLNPTITSAGTAKTPQNLRPLSALTSVATLGLSPSASANGTLVETFSVPAFSTYPNASLFILDPGQSLLVTFTQSSGAANVGLTLSYYEI